MDLYQMVFSHNLLGRFALYTHSRAFVCVRVSRPYVLRVHGNRLLCTFDNNVLYV